MAHIKIEPRAGAQNPNDIRILVDGVEVQDVSGYLIDHQAANGKPIVLLSVIAEMVDIELPDADVRKAGEEEEPPEPAPRMRSVLGPALSVLSQADADLRQGIDITLLATRYCSLGVRQRFTVMQVLGLLDGAEYAAGMGLPKEAERLDRDAIARAIRQGKLKDFAEAIADACDTYRICTHGGDFATCEICLTEWASAEMAARARSGRGGIEPGAGLSVLLPRQGASA